MNAGVGKEQDMSGIQNEQMQQNWHPEALHRGIS